MNDFIKYGDTYLRRGDNGSLFPITDRETLQGLKMGQLPYNSISNNRGLQFNSQDLNNASSSNSTNSMQASGSNPVDMKSVLQDALTKAISNYQGVSNASELEQKKQELLRKQLLSPIGKYAPGGNVSSLGSSGALNALGNAGKEYNPAIQELQLQINTARQGDAQSLSNLTKLLSLAKSTGMFGASGLANQDTAITNFGGNEVLINKQTGDVIKTLGPSKGSLLESNNPSNPYNPSVGGGESFLKTLSPQNAALVKGVANYKLSLSKITSLRSSAREKLTRMVMQYDPTFDMTQYATRAAIRKDFTSGKSSRSIRSLNTAVGHLKSLSEAFKKLDNTSYPIWNKIKNFGIEETGGGIITAVKNNINAVAGEMATVFKNSSGTDQEIKAWKDEISASQSPAQVKAGIDKMIELMGSRLTAFNSQWKSGIGKPKDFRILSDNSRKILSSMGVDVNAIDPTSVVQNNVKSSNQNTDFSDIEKYITPDPATKTATIPRSVWETLGARMDPLLKNIAESGYKLLVTN